MIAEIKGKISSSGSNLNDRLEDDLTGNVFGSLRYMSFNHGLKHMLMQGIYPRNLKNIIENINEEEWSQFIEFWPYNKEGEIDFLINFADTIIGVEVKYLSGISSDDDVNNNYSDLDETITLEGNNSINHCLENLKLNNDFEKVIVSDLKDLLIKKGFESFKNFIIEDHVGDNWYDFGVIKKSNISFYIKEDIEEELYYEFS